MAELYIPSTFAAFNQGAQAKQQDKERKQQKRFGELAGTLYSAQDRTPILAEMAQINPQGAMQFGQQFGVQDRFQAEQEAAARVKQAKATLYKANAVRTAAPGKKAAIWQQVAPEHYAQMAQDGITDEEIDMFIDQSLPQLYADAGMEPPKPDVESFAGQPVSMMIDGKPALARVGSRGTVQQVPGAAPYQAPDRTPAPQFVTLTPEEIQAAGLPFGTAAQRDTQGRITVLNKPAKPAVDNAAQVQNQRTWETYQTAMNALRQSMAATETGPLAGRIPAITSAQQTAEGSAAAMAPILKQIFRVAGEGTFTDKDQELLMKMVPTRQDNPEAREAKIQNIDNIIKSKLGLAAPQAQAPQGGIKFLGFE